MKKDRKIEEGKPVDEPIVLPDECGDSMWDTVLAQSPFIQDLKVAAKEESQEKKS